MPAVFEPFAVMLHRRHSAGDSVQQLAAEFEIPEERVSQRIRVAALYAERRKTQQGLEALGAGLEGASFKR